MLRTAEQEQFARPGARDQVDEAVAVNVHQLWTEPDASPRGDAALRPAVLEFLARCEPRVSGRPLVAIDPEDSLSELTDKKVHDAIAVEVAHEGRGVADVSIDHLAGCLQPDRRIRAMVDLGCAIPEHATFVARLQWTPSVPEQPVNTSRSC